MLRGIYAPTDLPSSDRRPDISTKAKLEIIKQAPVRVEYSARCAGMFYLKLPFVKKTTFALLNPEGDERDSLVYAHVIDLGNSELYRHGIGTRLMSSAARYALEQPDKPARFVTGWARLGVVNAAVRVFGEENVATDIEGKRYGWGSERKLDEMFDDYSAYQGVPYLVNKIDAQIDSSRAAAWEMPVPIAPTSE